MTRIVLFLLTNIAVLAIASVTLSVLGVPGWLASKGIYANLGNLLIFSAVFGMAGSFVSLLISKPMAKWSTGAQIIETPQDQREQWLLDTVRELSQNAGIKMPEVAIFPSGSSNAFATGWNKNNALVAVSEGLLHRLQQDEIRAVLGHEIGHVANGDMVTLSLIQGILNTFVIFFARVIGYLVDTFIFRSNNNGGGIGFFMVTIVMQILLGILASAVVMWFSRKREFKADEAGARLAGKQPMIGALNRLRMEAEEPQDLPNTLTAFGIRTGIPSNLTQRLFSSHPPLEERIKALQEL